MKKILLTLCTTATIASGVISTTDKNTAPTVQENCNEQWTIISNNEEATGKLQELLEKCGLDLDFLFQNNCPEPEETQPEPSTPEISVPESSSPETSAPETSVPETSAQENQVPETSPSETQAPETSPSETLAPETSPAETQAPETSAPETQVPETSAPETSAPETQVPETSAPETQAPATSPEETVHPYVLRIVELVNEERAAVGLNPVTLDTSASEGALVRAKEIVKSFSHTRPDGRSFSTALTEQGITYRTAGENIAWGQRSPEQVMDAWMNSSGHRANILNQSFTRIGVGYYQENGVNYWTQLFFG